MSKKPHPATIAAQAAHFIDRSTGAITPPVHPSTTFARDEDYALIAPAHSYARDENPTYEHAERVIRELEGGADCLLFSSGMAGIAAVLQTFDAGDHIVAPQTIYYGTIDRLQKFSAKRDIALTLFDASDDRALAGAIQPGRTKLVWIETPTNPMWDVIDIAAAAQLAHDAGAMLAVDSTAATPVITRPLEYGADLVFHSATKYLNGHSDVVAGALVTAQTDARWQEIHAERHDAGAIPGAFEAWLLQRGLRTLFVRVREASNSALKIAKHFTEHPHVERVLYAGLVSHPQHETAKRQMQNGFGGMLSICVKGGREAALGVAGRLQVFVRATSLGGVESLVEHRATIEGPQTPVPENLLRLSIGIEDSGDLIADLERALDYS